MAISPVSSAASALSASAALQPAGPSTGGNFGQMLSDMLGSLSQTEQSTNQLIAGAAAGENVDVHDVMIAMQSESLAFDLATQVRNKLVEAYQEVFRTQV